MDWLILCFIFSIATVQVKSDSKNLIVMVKDPIGGEIASTRDEQDIRHHFAAYYSGIYQICVQNMNRKEDEQFFFSFATGS